MLERIKSAGVLILVFGTVVVLSVFFKITVDITVACICIAAVYEFCKAIKTLKLYQISITSMAFAVIYPMLFMYDLSYILCYGYTAVMLFMIVFCHEKISFKDFAYTYSMTLLITVCMSAIVSMKELDSNHRIMYLVMAIAVPWLADVGAYFTGVFLGKHKLCPKISPKKTIEGAIGGIAFCILTTIIMGLLFKELIFGMIFHDAIELNYLSLIIIGIGGSLLSILGDLSFSVIKRAYSVKDYGDVIPGHGGILDRFDSVIPFVPFMYIVLKYLPIV